MKQPDIPPTEQPALPAEAGLPTSMQQVLTHLEPFLAQRRHARVLIQVASEQLPSLLVLCLDRLLHGGRHKSILLIVRQQDKVPLLHSWQKATSIYDGQRLRDLYSLSDAPHLRRVHQVHISLLSLREMQLVEREAQHPVGPFDAILVCVPARLSPVWKQVMSGLYAPALVGLCQHVTAEASAWFADQVLYTDKIGDGGPSAP